MCFFFYIQFHLQVAKIAINHRMNFFWEQKKEMVEGDIYKPKAEERPREHANLRKSWNSVQKQ